jgi:ketosteroid isomerase-like protein
MSTSTDTVSEMYAAFARGDEAAVASLLHPEVRWITPTLPWSEGLYEGPAEVGRYFASFNEALSDPRIEPDELLECGDTVVALGSESATVRATDRRFAVRFAHVIRLREGRVVELRGHLDTAAIAEAFGASVGGAA